MKLPSVACLYPSSSPFPSSHLITASLVLPSPPSLFTAAADGSILFWSLSSPSPSLHPTSILCGHSYSVTALASSPSNLNLLFSASSDSVLCAWSSSFPHRCRLRRRIPSPPPSLLVASADYVLIAAGSEVLVLHPSNLNVVRTIAVNCHVIHVSLRSERDVVAVDWLGRARKFALEEGKEEMDLQAGSQEISVEEGLIDEELRVCVVSADGKLLAVVGGARCMIKMVDDGVEIGEVCWEGMLPVLGVMFLDSGEGFVMWGGDGAAVVYEFLKLEEGFRLEVLGEIPAVGGELDERSSVQFCQFEGSLVRLVSICFVFRNSLLWKPYVSIWSIPSEQSDDSSIHSCVLVGERKFPEHRNGECSKDGIQIDDRVVSSSMVLSEDSYTPYAAVYGFYNGEIEVVRFVNLPREMESPFADQNQHGDSCTSELIFRGHTGAVLCLAARCISTNSLEQKIYRLLVSGSSDFTVRIWDLDSGSLMAVLHHHVAPVKQIILPSFWADHPWNNCFLSVGEDCCVALVSLETLRVERMFPGHPTYPSTVAWDSRRGYVACLCRNVLSLSDTGSVLYLWDVKSGARERKIKGTASISMFDHFCRGINGNPMSESMVGGSTSASSLHFPFIDVPNSAQSRVKVSEKGKVALPTTGVSHIRDAAEIGSTMDVSSHQVHGSSIHPVKSSCPFTGIAILEFDHTSLMSLHSAQVCNQRVSAESIENDKEIERLEICLLRFSLCFLHLWDVDKELDRLLMEEMDINRPDGFYIASGLKGDRGSLTLMFPGPNVSLELWKSSSEFCAMRSLAIVSVTQRMIKLSQASTTASSALAAFYTRKFSEKVPDIKPPSLQLLVSFWQDPSEHVRMAARSLFHCAAPRAIPHALSSKGSASLNMGIDSKSHAKTCKELDDSAMVSWMESFEIHEWISWIGGTIQDATASHIIVAAALVVWYPTIVKVNLSNLVITQLIKLVMSTNDRYSATAAELLAEGMENIWKVCLGSEITRLIGDIFIQIECLTASPVNNAMEKPAIAVNMMEALIEILLPSLAIADIAGFLNVVEGQIWATSSDSPVHQISLKTLIRVVRGSPKSLALYLDKAVSYVLQTMDPGNLVMRKACLKASITALREITRIFPMVVMNESSTRLAIGDAIGDIQSVTIRVYDLESVTKIKILDASAPLGLPSLLEGGSNLRMATAISALSFSPDGQNQGLVAFSENGLLIRWWPLGTVWWEKLSRNLVPVQCTKLILVPPWEGFSPNSSRTSIMANIHGHNKQVNSQDSTKELDDADSLKIVLHNLDLSYRLQWVAGRNVLLTRHGQELGTFPL